MKTAAVTFAPRRGRVLAAELATHAIVGLGYGIALVVPMRRDIT
ncbi:hypothetical protein [Micromonospora marina]